MSDKGPGERNADPEIIFHFVHVGVEGYGDSAVRNLMTKRHRGWEHYGTGGVGGLAWRQMPQSKKIWATVLRDASRLLVFFFGGGVLETGFHCLALALQELNKPG